LQTVDDSVVSSEVVSDGSALSVTERFVGAGGVFEWRATGEVELGSKTTKGAKEHHHSRNRDLGLERIPAKLAGVRISNESG
jgi:hypothetical protein